MFITVLLNMSIQPSPISDSQTLLLGHSHLQKCPPVPLLLSGAIPIWPFHTPWQGHKLKLLMSPSPWPLTHLASRLWKPSRHAPLQPTFTSPAILREKPSTACSRLLSSLLRCTQPWATYRSSSGAKKAGELRHGCHPATAGLPGWAGAPISW